MTLTVTNDLGLTNTSPAQFVTVGAGAAPTPAFVFSPTSPAPQQQVNFDANKSTPGAGHTIVRFVWNFGDGSSFVDSGSPITNHTFAAAGSYVVSLTVSDETGQNATGTQTVTVGLAPPTASFIFTPTTPAVGQSINFDGSLSKAASGHSLTRYVWNWGDGNPPESFIGPTAAHAFGSAVSYVVTLTVTDDVGQSASANLTVKVGP